ncbi:PREDICTED: VEGF coregulated chemokine 1 [Chinchilla lanigera]|uniref:C-X-C motif chemokine ligand 17 n=1 Tax=Chinchilla lanigera TaxID=34839 RepID=A0A8C2YIT4_CHILA|nr:PREDICTED: VEGF coregulated chemokine 1 [Chinchilla lanigera]
MKVTIAFLLLLLPLTLMSTASSSPNSGVARGRRDQRQAPRSRLREGGQECECKDWFLRALRRKLMAVSRLPKKQCPCDRVKVNVKKSRHQRHHRKPSKHSRACQEFLKQCQLASIALPL